MADTDDYLKIIDDNREVTHAPRISSIAIIAIYNCKGGACMEMEDMHGTFRSLTIY